MPEVDGQEAARRLRAMWGFSLLSQEAFIEALELDVRQGRDMLRRTRPVRAPEDVLRRAARLVGFSEAFALEGAAAIAPEDPTLDERVEALERRHAAEMDQLRDRLDQIMVLLGRAEP